MPSPAQSVLQTPLGPPCWKEAEPRGMHVWGGRTEVPSSRPRIPPWESHAQRCSQHALGSGPKAQAQGQATWGPHHTPPALAAPPTTGACLVKVEPHDETLLPSFEKQRGAAVQQWYFDKVSETIHFHSNF